MSKDKELKQALDRLTELLAGADLSREDLLETYESVAKARKAKLEEEMRLKQQQQKQEHQKKIESIFSMDLPLDFENSFQQPEVSADSVSDGLILSITNLGKVDIEYISAITSTSMQEVIMQLKGSIYQNPETFDECFYKGWETADCYLSGNIMRKLRLAEEANQKYNNYFASNVEALSKLLPPQFNYKGIYVTLGSPWLPSKYIDEFIIWLLGVAWNSCSANGELYDSYKIQYEPVTGTWNIPLKTRYSYSVKSTKTFGTSRMHALNIIEKTLNQQAIQVFDEMPSKSNKSGKKKVLNQHETVNALEKQREILRAFNTWIWRSEARRKDLESIYLERYGTCLRRSFDGSFLTLPNISSSVNLRPYQKNAVAKILLTPNVLLAHEVGAGKTYVMIVAGMELKRMGISQKNLYVVPNNILGQWKAMFKEVYPQSKVLTITPKDFVPEKRISTLKRVRDEDFDAIIMAYSSFELIPLSRQHYLEQIDADMEVITQALKKGNDIGGKLYKRRQTLEKMAFEVKNSITKGMPEIYFDELGINTLFVDEAHNYKNVPIESKTGNILGLNKTGSVKCKEMLEKVRCVQKQNNGRGVVFATGTPITNSITDVFVMQTYLQYGELKLLDLHLFDNWVGMFAEKVDEFEIDVTTSGYRVGTRFARFHNLPELTSLLAQVADFLHCPHSAELPEFNGYTDKLIGRTKALEDYINDISNRADLIRQGQISRAEDNMLKITTDGRKAALDMRLVDSGKYSFTMQSKSCVCAEIVADIYHKTREAKSTQIIFCDTSVPSDGFNLYTDIRGQLEGLNVLPHEIAFIHDFNTEKRKEELFSKMQEGAIRVLLGSTFKLGIGVNVQQKLCAIHHLDIPWRPSDMVQREGRILRQGNENEEIAIYRYITEGSFDAYSWQLLETKQRFIVDILSGFSVSRTTSDIDNTVLSYAEVKALAIGNPLVKQRIQTVNELMRVNALQKNQTDNNAKLKHEEAGLPTRMARVKDIISRAEMDLQDYLANAIPIKNMPEREEIRQTLQNAITANVILREDTLLFRYQGFKVYLPANMISVKPFVWVVGNGRYMVEMSGNDRGNLIRIDHCLNGLQDYITRQREELAKLEHRAQEVASELAKSDSYGDRIAELRAEIVRIDKELGVGKK